MKIPPELLPVLQITLPLLAGMFLAGWMQNKRLDDIVARLGRIEELLRLHGERITRLEERIPPLIHR
jgi:hypothetical protein